MNEYESRTPEEYENELDSLQNKISDGPIHVWYVGSIDRKLFLICCRISDLLASRAQCRAESKTLIRIITFKRKRLLILANEMTDEIEKLLEIKDKYEDLKHEILTYINHKLHTGTW